MGLKMCSSATESDCRKLKSAEPEFDRSVTNATRRPSRASTASAIELGMDKCCVRFESKNQVCRARTRVSGVCRLPFFWGGGRRPAPGKYQRTPSAPVGRPGTASTLCCGCRWNRVGCPHERHVVIACGVCPARQEFPTLYPVETLGRDLLAGLLTELLADLPDSPIRSLQVPFDQAH